MEKERLEWQRIGRLICLAELKAVSQSGRQELDEWIAADPEREELRNKVREWLSDITPDDMIDADQAWSRFVKQYRLGPNHRILRIWKYAAALVIPLVIGLTFLIVGNVGNNKEIRIYAPASSVVMTLDDGREFLLDDETERIRLTEEVNVLIHNTGLQYELGKADAKVRFTTIQVPEFGFFTITLSDGTAVMLNSNTSLRYAVPFDGGKREVWLDGEAFFDVTRDDTAPFSVHTAIGDIRVLGTSFNVKAYQYDSMAVATLVDGSVECRMGGESLPLAPGNQAVFDPETGKLTSYPADLRLVTAWTRNQFYFKNETLGNIMDELSHWYDVDIAFKEHGLADQIFTLEIGRHEDMNKILDVLVKTDRLKYLQTGRKVMIYR